MTVVDEDWVRNRINTGGGGGRGGGGKKSKAAVAAPSTPPPAKKTKTAESVGGSLSGFVFAITGDAPPLCLSPYSPPHTPTSLPPFTPPQEPSL